ncbi:MAG: hypothetical protein LJE92_01745 [Gammaproteobacteria bacterium]|jgi:two-component system sensor histidine kinase QseC|nr:hypothetical protein [Gammaproteobacteria bacterium]
MRSISKTITISTILSVALILVAGQLVVDRVVSGWVLQQFDDALQAKARALVTLTKFDGNEVELDFADEFMPEFEASENPEYFELYLGDGRLLETSRSFGRHAEPQFSDQAEEVAIADVMLPDGRKGRRIAVKFTPQIGDDNEVLRISIAPQDRPRAILRVSTERETLDAAIQQFHLIILGISLVVLVAVMLSVSRAIKLGLAPLNQIKTEISQISPNAIDRRISSRNQPIELEPIATQFNRVLAEIENAFIREREFSSDVAHELRTPVAEIKSLAEVGLRWPDEKDIQSYFADIYDSSRQLDRLIENLLHLCRSEEGDIELELIPIELEEIIDKIILGVSAETNERNITIERVAGLMPTIQIDPQWFELILKNLLFNAVAHSPDGSVVTIEVISEAGFCALEIENPMAVPLGEQDLPMIFKRLWRKDTSRATGRHAGIGLSLVKSFADLMNLEVNASISRDLFHLRLSRIRTC